MSLGTIPKVWSILMVAALATLFCGVSLAQEEGDLAAVWETTVQGPMGEATVLLTLENNDGQWSGQMSDPSGEGQAIEEVRITGNRLQFKIPLQGMSFKASFSGTLDPETDILTGSMTVPNFPEQEMKFHRRKDSVQSDDGGKKYRVGSGPAGVWISKIRAPDGEDTPVTLTLDNETGDYTATLEDPFVEVVQGENVKVTDTMISFTFRPEGAAFPSHFTGTYVAADDRVSGSFSQRGVSRFVRFRRDPSTVILGIGPDGEIIEPARRRHQHHFAITGRLSYWPAIHMVKDETYNLNAITTSQLNFDGAIRWFVMDGFSLFARGFRGGLGFTDDADKLAVFEEVGLTSESQMKLDGWEFGLTGYLGNMISEDSRFNPYFTGVGGKTSWEVTTGERGTDIIALEDRPLEGKDWAFGFGLGTEYEMGSSLNLEFEWMWRYFMTKDETIWVNTEENWSNTHAWSLSVGLTYLFF